MENYLIIFYKKKESIKGLETRIEDLFSFIKGVETKNDNSEQTVPSRRSRVEIEDDLDDDELDTIACGSYAKPSTCQLALALR